MRDNFFENSQLVFPGTTSIASAMFALTILVGVFSGPSCHAATDAADVHQRNLSQLVAGIVTRAADLNYITEQDSEVIAFYRNSPVEELTEGVFLTLLRQPAGISITRRQWAGFFDIQTRGDPTGSWKEIREYLEANLTNLTVFQLSRSEPYDAQYDLYAVGIFNGDTVVGIQMFGVAT